VTIKPTYCKLEPGGEECGCEAAAPTGVRDGCSGTIHECMALGNEENFGGFPHVPEARTEGELEERVRELEEELEGLKTDLEDETRELEVPFVSHASPQGHDRPGGLFADAVAEKVVGADGYLVGLSFFRDRDEAVAQATAEAFRGWYDDPGADNRIRIDDLWVSADHALDWIRRNRHVVRSVLGVLA